MPLMTMGIGVTLAVAGSFLAARLVRLDRLWLAVGGTSFEHRAANARHDLLALAADPASIHTTRTTHPLIRAAAPMLQQRGPETAIRQQLLTTLSSAARPWRLARGLGRILGLACPIGGLGLLVAGLFSALGVLQGLSASAVADGAGGNSGGAGVVGISGSGALSLMALVIAVPLVNTVSRRLPKRGSEPELRNELLAQAVLEGLLTIASTGYLSVSNPPASTSATSALGTPPDAVLSDALRTQITERFDELLGPVLEPDAPALPRRAAPAGRPSAQAA